MLKGANTSSKELPPARGSYHQLEGATTSSKELCVLFAAASFELRRRLGRFSLRRPTSTALVLKRLHLHFFQRVPGGLPLAASIAADGGFGGDPSASSQTCFTASGVASLLES